MSEIADAVEEYRAAIAAEAADILPDVCSFTGPGSETRDSHGEITTSDSSVLSNVPCAYESLSAYERQVGGSVVAGATHKLKLPANADTLAIAGTYRGTIAARGTTPAKSFEVTGRLDDSMSAFLYLAISIK